MKRCCVKTDAKGVFPEIARTRHDQISAELVEKGIALQEARGTTYAAKYLQAQWIGMNVALRVLAHPAERRRSN